MSDTNVLAILNTESGTLKTADPQAISQLIITSFADAGKSARCEYLTDGEFEHEFNRAISSTDADTIIVAGGDGTVSAAASQCIEKDLALGILPTGTMNLFARTLGIPFDLEDAVRALANGETVKCDVGVANGRPFIHQFSVGLQPKVIQERDSALSHNSRFGKLLAGLRTTISVVRRPPSFAVVIDKDGVEKEDKLSFIAVSNNLYGEGHLPYADKVDGDILGIYSARRLMPRDNLKLIADLTLGSWSTNPNFMADSAKRVILEFPRRKRTNKAVIDGELIPLEDRVEIEILSGALKVLRPKPSQ